MHIGLSDPPLMSENGCFSGTGDFAAEKKGLKALPNDTFSFLQSGWEVIQETLWTNLLGVSGVFRSGFVFVSKSLVTPEYKASPRLVRELGRKNCAD